MMCVEIKDRVKRYLNNTEKDIIIKEDLWIRHSITVGKLGLMKQTLNKTKIEQKYVRS